MFNIFQKIRNKIWFKIKYRNNEFDKKLDFDINKYSKMTNEDRTKYSMDLIKKRNLAHNLDCENIDKESIWNR